MAFFARSKTTESDSPFSIRLKRKPQPIIIAMIAAEYRRRSRSRHDFRLHHYIPRNTHHHRRYRHNKSHSISTSDSSTNYNHSNYHRTHANHTTNDRHHRHNYHKVPHSRSRGRCPIKNTHSRNTNKYTKQSLIHKNQSIEEGRILHRMKRETIAHETNEIQNQPTSEEYSYFSETSGELSVSHHRRHHRYGGYHRKPLERRRVRLEHTHHHCNGCACNKYSMEHAKECSKSKRNLTKIDDQIKSGNQDRGSFDTKHNDDGSDDEDDSTGEDLEGLVLYKNVRNIYRERC